ncbi:MAG: hypothetical protein NUW02_01445 [Candidatus Campbellbacteria bacterium]|nr:hypothetical protein [Candidatus Campbellbacteria bacterium]
MDKKQKSKTYLFAISATAVLLLVYIGVVTAVSGWKFAQDQFGNYWYFLVSLAGGFGVQVGLYSYLKQLVTNGGMVVGGKIMATTGTTSTLTMISCCAHYLANIVPILGIAGVLSTIAQYQVEFFWVGLAFNALGIVFISNKIITYKRRV